VAARARHRPPRARRSGWRLQAGKGAEGTQGTEGSNGSKSTEGTESTRRWKRFQQKAKQIKNNRVEPEKMTDERLEQTLTKRAPAQQ
jgi:hypothetical protein